MEPYCILRTEETDNIILKFFNTNSVGVHEYQYINVDVCGYAYFWHSPDYPLISFKEFCDRNNIAVLPSAIDCQTSVSQKAMAIKRTVTEGTIYEMLNIECRESGAINPHKAAKKIHELISSGNQYCLFNTETGRYYSGEYWLEIPVYADLREVAVWTDRVMEK